MLIDKGLTDGDVSSQVEPLDSGGVKVVFGITDEQKIRIKRVHFDGAEIFDQWRLRWEMKKTRESHFFGSLTGGSTYTEEQYAEDLEKVREVYLNNGFVDVSFGPAEMEYADGYSRFLLWKSPKRWLDLNIPIAEGKQYRVGNIDVDGAEVFPAEFIKGFFGLTPGEVYDESKVTKGLETLRELYGSRGFVQFTGFPIKTPVEDSDLVDVTINLNEDQQYFVNKIEFKGNTTTRDKVIRREMFLNEQDVMNMDLLKMSIQRINQLGYFQPIEQPEIEAAVGEENKLDITLRLAEQNRNQFTFGGGVSGLEGAFINLAFSTTNFLGRGETASFSLSDRQPHSQLFDWAHRSLFHGQADYARLQYLQADLEASGIYASGYRRGARVGHSAQALFAPVSELQLLGYQDVGAGSRPRPDRQRFLPQLIFFGSAFPRDRGKLRLEQDHALFRTQYDRQPDEPLQGEALYGQHGGCGRGPRRDGELLQAHLRGIWYLPVSRTTNFGFRAMASWLKSTTDFRVIEGEIDEETGDAIFNVEQTGIPFFERFFLGGENQIRGYDIRTIGPRGPTGIFIGGNKMILFNVEYYIPIAGPLRAVLYFDAGQAYAENQPWSFDMFAESFALRRARRCDSSSQC